MIYPLVLDTGHVECYIRAHMYGGPETVDGRVSLPDAQIDLDEQWIIQANRLLELGFHRELGLSADEYLTSLPRFAPRPEGMNGRFNIHLLVETRILPQMQAKLAGLDFDLKDYSVADCKDPLGYETPNMPYSTWMQDGRIYLNTAVIDMGGKMTPDERGATIYDGIALFLFRQDILDDHGITLPGTVVGTHYAPTLSKWPGKPKLDCDHRAYAFRQYGAATCARN